jgi:parallel beta-helix repeat protein
MVSSEAQTDSMPSSDTFSILVSQRARKSFIVITCYLEWGNGLAPIIDRELQPYRNGKVRNRSSKALVLATIVVAVLIVGAIAGLLAQIVNNKESHQSESPEKIPTRITYVVRSPILINGNGDFTAANGVVSGGGTASDPYIIADWDITASSDHGIWIQDTDEHFILRDCQVHDSSGMYDGLMLSNCVNGTVENNDFWNDGGGIVLSSSSRNTLINNTCISNPDSEGIFLASSSNNTLINNTCNSNGGAGIGLFDSDNNTLVNNSCSSNNYGMYLYVSSNNNTISNNSCSNSLVDGICLVSSNGNTLSNNNCSSNLAWGISLDYSSNNTLNNNNCSSNSNDGMMLDSSSNNNTLVSNRGFWNFYNGIDVVSSRDNTLVSNNWSSNGFDGAYIGYSTNTTLDSNNCSSNNRWGMQFGYSSGTVMLRNQLCYNLQYGICVWSGSSSNFAFNNTFIGNNGAGSTYDSGHVQAIDDGPSNWWNSTDGYGNYWSDWTDPDDDMDGIVDLPYNISGSAGAKDYYPLTTPQAPIPEFGMMPFVVILMAAILLTMRTRLRKA